MLVCRVLPNAQARRYLVLADVGLHPLGCQSWPGLPWACFHGESLGSFFIVFFVLKADARVSVSVCRSVACFSPAGCFCASAAGGVVGDSGSAATGESILCWLAFICVTPLPGSLLFSICSGCCLSGASRAEGSEAHRASAWAARTLMCCWRATSCRCSAREGGS